MRSILAAAADLESGHKARDLVEDALARIEDCAGEGRRTFLEVNAGAARVAADFHDQMRAHGAHARFAGIPVSIKDLFDIAGEVTTAGSLVLRDTAPATADAPAVARLRAAGFIPVGRTNMTEFAFSGLGINPHHGTPANPYDRGAARIPGGSSSGAAVSITDGMALGALGTDTGGSCRIPAALCGIVGFKPTARRVPTQGAFPLSTSLDSVGPLAASVSCCAVLDAVLAGEASFELPELPPAGLRLAVPQTMVLDGVEPAVARAFDRSLAAIGKAGARISDIALRELDELSKINAKGGFVTAQAYAIHRPLIAKGHQAGGPGYDPQVLVRILRGQEQEAADYIDLVNARTDFIRRLAAITAPYDALVMPTVPLIAPKLADLRSDDAYRRTNAMVLRNPALANFLDRCSISIPCHQPGDAPVGLMLIGEHGADRRLLVIAAAIEKIVSPAIAA